MRLSDIFLEPRGKRKITWDAVMGANGSSYSYMPPAAIAPAPAIPAIPMPDAVPAGVPLYSDQTLSVATDTHGVPQYPSDDVVRSMLVHAPNNRMESAVTMMAEYNSNVARLSQVSDASLASWHANEAAFAAARDGLRAARAANLAKFDAELKGADAQHGTMVASYDKTGANIAEVTAHNREIVADAAAEQAGLRREASRGAVGDVCRRLESIKRGVDDSNRAISSKVGANFLHNRGLEMRGVAQKLEIGCDVVDRN